MQPLLTVILTIALTFTSGLVAHRLLLPLFVRALGQRRCADLRGVDAGPIIANPTIVATLTVLLLAAMARRPQLGSLAARPHVLLGLAASAPAVMAALVSLRLRYGFRDRRRRQFEVRDGAVLAVESHRPLKVGSFRVTSDYWQTDAFHGYIFYRIELQLEDEPALANEYVSGDAAAEDAGWLRELGIPERITAAVESQDMT